MDNAMRRPAVRTTPAVMPSLALEQQIGQLFAVGFAGTTAPPEVLDLIERDHIGSVILFSRNIHSREQTAALADQLQAAARAAGNPFPLLIMADQENGLVRRLAPDSTIFPGNMALGALAAADGAEAEGGAQSEEAEALVYAVARATARELLAHGITMNLAPVVDVNSNPANPVIGVRSFGERAEHVARLGAITVRGYQDAGVIATLKHFPGHGDTAVDSHRTLPVVAADLDRLEATELVPFRRGIQAGADAVMIAHVALPALNAGDLAPATIAPAVTRGLLRERLGFDGLVVSDCLEMGAIVRTIGTTRGAVAALRAGIDIALISHRHEAQRAAIDAVHAAVAAGRLSEERVAEAAGRVTRVKARYLSAGFPAAPLTPAELAAHQALRDLAYARSTTVARDDAGLLPLRPAPGDELLVIHCPSRAISNAVDIPYRSADLVDALRQHHARVQSVTLTPESTHELIEIALRAAGTAALVVAVTLNAHLDGQQQEFVCRVVATGRPVIGVAACDPYDARALPEVRSYLLTYEHSRPALVAAAQALFGVIQARGRPPVTLTSDLL